MIYSLLLTFALGNPYQVVEPNPFRVAPVADTNAVLRRAIAAKTFLVWVDGAPMESIPAWTGTEVRITGPWYEGSHSTYATLQSPTRQQIEKALATARSEWETEKARVSLRANPFRWPLASAAHDVDLSGAGPLPDGFDIAGMARYKRAAFTQEIAVTDGRDRITPVSRLAIHARDQRWLLSGGMLGVNFRSDLYRNDKATSAKEYVGDIAVWNGSNFQNNRGWRREFADGSKFLDVLSSDGKVFEIRQREKAQGRWNSEVVYENEKARPLGYAGLTVSCSKCHNASDGAGTGPYAGALVPGSDTVLSFPFKALEK